MICFAFFTHTFNPIIKTICAIAHAPIPFIYLPPFLLPQPPPYAPPKKKPFCFNNRCNRYLRAARTLMWFNTRIKKKKEIKARRDNFRHADVFKSAAWPRPSQISPWLRLCCKERRLWRRRRQSRLGRWALSVLGKPAASGAVFGLTTYK